MGRQAVIFAHEKIMNEPAIIPLKMYQRPQPLDLWIGRCRRRGCTTIKRVQSGQWPAYLLIHCRAHRGELEWRRICGTVSEHHKCDSRCTNAKGSDCECSCGGANHGAAHV